jgi:hypothetical protein
MIEWKHLWVKLVLLVSLLWTYPLQAQRTYAPLSVLSAGNWFQVKVPTAGVYKLDLNQLAQMGGNFAGTPSTQIRVYGNGGGHLPEANDVPVIDDLRELAIWVEDGGDGLFNNNDYILFYGEGPHRWQWDSVARDWQFHQNLYTRFGFYYITAQAGSGKRIQSAAAFSNANLLITQFQERYHHELDTINFLSSGQSWYGEEFAQLPGRVTTRTFPLPFADVLPNTSLRCRSNVVARSVNNASVFSCSLNAVELGNVTIPATTVSALDPFARVGSIDQQATVTQAAVSIQFQFQPGGTNAQGWLNFFDVFCTRPLRYDGKQPILFGTNAQAAPNAVAAFEVSGAASGLQVWQIEDPAAPKRVQTSIQGNTLRFEQLHARYIPYCLFDPRQAVAPILVGRVENQNLHGSLPADLLIITTPILRPAALELAQFHQLQDQMTALVVNTTSIYHEFGGGSADPAAIRNFVKMMYDRAGSDSTKRPKYLLLFGDASYDPLDRVQQNTQLVPSWQHPLSLDPLATYNSDDFFGFLDDQDDINSGLRIHLLDIGIGRIPAKTLAEASSYVQKIKTYHQPASLGAWRNESIYIADDEDFNAHLDDAEIITAAAAQSPLPAVQKIYLDAFQQRNAGNGNRYPDVNDRILNEVQRGVLLLNYSGHGSYQRLAEETIVDKSQVDQWQNEFRLPLIVTATCDFAPYDNPVIASLGEDLLVRPRSGAIALMTTTRLVFAFSNRIMNRNYVQTLLRAPGDIRLGDAVRQAKNLTYTSSADVINNRKFTLLGDPALRFGAPKLGVVLEEIWDLAGQRRVDTLRGLSTYRLRGTVRDSVGQLITSANGELYISVYEKPRVEKTKGNDPQSFVATYTQDQAILFKGKASLANGRFETTFMLPTDMSATLAPGAFRLYAASGNRHWSGFDPSKWMGGAAQSSSDKIGPQIEAWINDRSFVNGTLVGIRPVLLADLFDSSGINIIRRTDGQFLSAQLDQQSDQIYPLYDFYEAAQDNFRKGSLRFQLPELSPGLHTLTIRAWDLAGNANEKTIEFLVGESENLTLSRVFNYPNPFTTKTQFWFEHNRPGEEMLVTVQVFTLTGKLVKVIRQAIFSSGNRSREVEWDGKDEFGDKLGRGTYFYDIKVRTKGGQQAQATGKIFML